MIKINYEPYNSTISFTGDSFDQVLAYCKKNRFVYNPETKKWSASARKILSAIPELEDIDFIDIDDITLYKLQQEASPKPNIQHTKIRYNRNNLKAPPLGEYQKEGIKYGLKNNAIVFNWSVGAGKSFSAVGIQNHLFKKNYTNKLIIVAIGAVLYNWKRELLQFGFFEEDDIKIVTSQDKEPFDKTKKVLIMTYTSFRIISEYWCQKKRNKLLKLPKETYLPIDEWSEDNCSVILDEVHKIKNPKSKRSRWVQVSSDKFKHKILMTGTLMPKDFLDIYSPMKFLDKALVDNLSYSDFMNEVCELGNSFSKWAVNGFIEERIQYFNDKFSPYIHYIDKRNVPELKNNLPNYNKKVIYMELEGLHKNIYRKVIQSQLYKIAEDEDNNNVMASISGIKIQNSFPYIIQSLSDPELLKKKIEKTSPVYNDLQKWKFNKNQRIEYCNSIISDHLEEEKGSKFLIWCVNPDTIERLADYYKKYKPLYIHGSSTPKGQDSNKYRDDLIQQFENNKEHKILIANPATIGVGQNIKGANVSIFYNKSYEYEAYAQAIGRNDRPNGPWKEIYEYNLVFDKTFDMQLERVIENRTNLNKLFSNTKYLNQDQLKKLFNGEEV